MEIKKIKSDLRSLANREKALILQRFFKTGKGEYGEGDRFLGVMVPDQRKVANKYFKTVTLAEINKLLYSSYHEERLTALLMLVAKFNQSLVKEQTEIFRYYIKHSQQVNNWDLVDLTAPNIIGAYTFNHSDSKTLYQLVKSENLWQRRIAIVATFYYLRQGRFTDTFSLAEILIKDDHDLIHKAVGWMLREVGKRGGKNELINFLNKHVFMMPRTMLRYAIEKFPDPERKKYLNIKKYES